MFSFSFLFPGQILFLASWTTLLFIAIAGLVFLIRSRGKFRLSKTVIVVLAVIVFAFLFYMFNPVKMGYVGTTSYGLPGPYWKASDRTEDWMVENSGSGRVSLSSKKIYAGDTEMSATISIKIDTVNVRPVVSINLRKFDALVDAGEYRIVFSKDSGRPFDVTAELEDKDLPEFDETLSNLLSGRGSSLKDLGPDALMRYMDIRYYLENDWLRISGKDALKIIRKLRKAEKDMTMLIHGDDEQTAFFVVDVTGFKEAYAVFANSVERYEKDNPVDMSVFRKICRRLGIYF